MIFRRLAVLSLVLLIVGCAAGLWAARSAVTDPFVAPGAANIVVAEIAPGQRQISYVMPNPDDGWQTAVARRLSISGWRLADDRYQWGGTETITAVAIYTRTSRVWFLEVYERAELLGDRSNALIKISYMVHLRFAF
jgi:hypothetical protein